jgi:hypothetical protein
MDEGFLARPCGIEHQQHPLAGSDHAGWPATSLLGAGIGGSPELLTGVLYLPLSKIIAFSPATKALAPYWDFFIEPDANPLYPR